MTSAAAYLEGTVASGADGLLRVTVDGQSTLMQACRPFPIYTPGAYRMPVAAADVDGKPWQNGDAGWFMQATSSHIRTAILEPENNFVTTPIDNVIERRETLEEVAGGGRDELAPVLLHYRPGDDNPLPRRWYIQVGLNPDFEDVCNTFGLTCDEYPFYSTAESSTTASLMGVASNENDAQGSDLNQFYNAPNGCGLVADQAAGLPAAFLVIPMSKFGLAISQNFPGVPLPSAYVCPDRRS